MKKNPARQSVLVDRFVDVLPLKPPFGTDVIFLHCAPHGVLAISVADAAKVTELLGGVIRCGRRINFQTAPDSKHVRVTVPQ